MPVSALRKLALTAGASLVGCVGYLLSWPVPVEPVSWQPPKTAGYSGAYAANTRLTALQVIDLEGEEGPEHMAIGPDGKLYVAVAGGKILRFNPDGSEREIFANSGGRVLGFDFDAHGVLIAADAIKGLIAVTRAGIKVLADHVTSDDPIGFADAVTVAPNGLVYFTDATTRFSPAQWGGTFEASVLDVIEQSATGRVLVFDPATGKTDVVAQGFTFANGIVLSADSRSIFVVESGKYRVWKIDSAARGLELNRASSQAKVLLDNLPGYPDNLMRGLDGKIWLGLAKPRSATVDELADKPFWRKVTLRLPRFLWPVPKPYGHVVALTEDGRIVANLQDPSGFYPETTGVTETPDRLYIQSLHAHSIGWLPR